MRTRISAVAGCLLALSTVLGVTSVGAPAVAAGDGGRGLAPLLRGNPESVLPGRYIVVLDRASGASGRVAAKSQARSHGAHVTDSYGTSLNGFAASLSAQALDAVRQNPHVAYVEADHRVESTTTQSGATWGIDRVDQRSLPLDGDYSYDETGAGVTAYIIDTGIRTKHRQFRGRVAKGFTAIKDGRGVEDCNGHGTHVSGIVGAKRFGVAKRVTLKPVRVLNCKGRGSDSGVIAGIEWVTANHAEGAAAVANMSLGGPVSLALDNAVKASIADGVTYAVAAGNETHNACLDSPADVNTALTVGSTTRTDTRSWFSNFGSCVDLFAPGSGITSAWNTSNKATKTLSGTSMASPHVAGVAALYLQTHPSASPDAVGNALLSAATAGAVASEGFGSPDLLLYSLVG